jgi:hypothetical protein
VREVCSFSAFSAFSVFQYFSISVFQYLLDAQAGLQERAGDPGGGEAEQSAGVFKVAVDEGFEVRGRGGQVGGGERIAHESLKGRVDTADAV